MIHEVLGSTADSLRRWLYRQRVGLWSRKSITALPDRESKLSLDSSSVDEGWYGFVAKSPTEIILSVRGSGQFLKAMIMKGPYVIGRYRLYTSEPDWFGDIDTWAALLYALEGIALGAHPMNKPPPHIRNLQVVSSGGRIVVARNATEFAASLLLHMWMPHVSLAACHHRAGKGPSFAIGQKEWSFYRVFCAYCNNHHLGSGLRGTLHIDEFLGGRRVYRYGIVLSCDAGHDIAVVTDYSWRGFED